MRGTTGFLALAASISSATAAFQGFNYGSTFTTGAAKAQSDFEAEFKTAQGLVGTNGGFTSARLYTTIQAGTPNAPISAIPAAIKTKTSLLLGLWASAGEEAFSNELQALKSAIEQYGSDFASLVAGISVGSEDLYRISPTGLLNKENPGAPPATIAGYIKQVRDLVAGTALSKAPVGHVDTWTAWVNGSNQAVTDACDWVGVDAYPYFEETLDNGIENNKKLFLDAVDQTRRAAGGKPLWITETGFPISGKTSGKAVASTKNAKTYWDEVGCPMFGSTNVWWYTLQDAAPDTPNPSFGVIGNPLTTKPLYDLSCGGSSSSSSSSSTASSRSATSSSTGSSSGSGSGSGSGSDSGSGSGSGSGSDSGSGSSSGSSPGSSPSSSSSAGGYGNGGGSGSSSVVSTAAPYPTGGYGSGSNTTVSPTGGAPAPTSSYITSAAAAVSGSAAAGLALVLGIMIAL